MELLNAIGWTIRQLETILIQRVGESSLNTHRCDLAETLQRLGRCNFGEFGTRRADEARAAGMPFYMNLRLHAVGV